MRELFPSEQVVFSMINIARKDKVYRPCEFFHALSLKDFGLKDYEVRSHINNKIQRFTKLGIFKKISFGHYRLMVPKKTWETIAKKEFGLIEESILEPEVASKEIHDIIDQSAKIIQLETKFNILAAAFISIGLKLKNSTDIQKILIETSEKIELAVK